MICALKFKHEQYLNVDIPKAVFSYWPIYNKCTYYCTCCNISITFRNLLVSSGSFSGAMICFPKNHIRSKIFNFSYSLLDKDNPLTTSYTGEYKKKINKHILLKYDGVDNVYVDNYLSFRLLNISRSSEVDLLEIKLSKSIPPGSCVAVRFIFKNYDLFYIDNDDSMHFNHNFFLADDVIKLFGEKNILRLNIPALTTYDSMQNGGFDVFYYMPLELKGDEFSGNDPISRVLPQYDFIGRRTIKPLKKFCWNAQRYFKLKTTGEPIYFGIGNAIKLSGVFSKRINTGVKMLTVNNRDGNVVIDSTLDNTTLSVNKKKGELKEIDQIASLQVILNDLKNELKKTKSISEDQRTLIDSFSKPLKSMSDPKTFNKNIFAISVKGLIEATRSLSKIAPSIVNIVNKLKELF